MLSTLPVMSSTDGFFGKDFPVFPGGFTPWDFQEPPLVFPHQDEMVVFPPKDQEPIFPQAQTQEPVIPPSQTEEPVISNSGSDHSSPIHISGSSGSDEPTRKRDNSNSGSDEGNLETSIMEERKRRRMMSNRESARRSRMRKQKHLENLRNQVNRLRIGNRELTNRLRLLTHCCQIARSDNERLRSESNILRQRLWDIRQVLYVRELQQQLRSSTICTAMQQY